MTTNNKDYMREYQRKRRARLAGIEVVDKLEKMTDQEFQNELKEIEKPLQVKNVKKPLQKNIDDIYSFTTDDLRLVLKVYNYIEKYKMISREVRWDFFQLITKLNEVRK